MSELEGGPEAPPRPASGAARATGIGRLTALGLAVVALSYPFRGLRRDAGRGDVV